MENNCVKLIRNPSTITEIMVHTNWDGWTDARTHIYRTVIVTTMSRSAQKGTTKIYELLSQYFNLIFTTKSKLSTTRTKKAFENIVEKRENAVNPHFLLFPQGFLSFAKEI